MPQNVEAIVIDHEDAARAFAVGGAQRAGVDSFGTAMNGVGRRVAGARGQSFRLDHFHDLRLLRIRLGVDDVDARGVDAGHDQVAALNVRMRRVRAKAGAAGVPSEMVQFVANVGHVQLPHQVAVGGGLRVDIHHAQRVGPIVAVRVQHGDVGQLFRGRQHGEFRGWIESGIWAPKTHRGLRFSKGF